MQIPSSWCPCTLLSAKQNPLLHAGRSNVNEVQLVCVWCIRSQQPTGCCWVLYKAQWEAHSVSRTGGWEHLCTPAGDPLGSMKAPTAALSCDVNKESNGTPRDHWLRSCRFLIKSLRDKWDSSCALEPLLGTEISLFAEGAKIRI